jgi:hypothetical protein
MVMFDHSLAAYEILQAALRKANKQYSDAHIADHGNCEASLGVSKATVLRFRKANLKEYIDNHDNFPLAYRAAEKLWNYLEMQGFVKQAFRERPSISDNGPQTKELVAIATSAFYNVDEIEISNWHDNMELNGKYFCYKRSFRSVGNILKTAMTFKLAEAKYFEISERQASKSGPRASQEQSSGFGFSRSERLWLFLKEESRHQPRIFCFNQKDTSNGKVTHLKGYVLESDKRYGDGVHQFRVGLIAAETDEKLWEIVYPDEPYDEEAQIDNVPFEDALARQNLGRRVIFDQYLLQHIKPDFAEFTAKADSPTR